MMRPSIFMQAILKNRRGQKPTFFIGAIGTYLIEILDDDPLISKLLIKTKHKYKASCKSRTKGQDKRMVLKTFKNDALIILKNAIGSEKEWTVLLLINNSQESSENLLRDAKRLARDRWPKVNLLRGYS